MFKRIKQGMNIEKAFILCEEEMHIPLREYFDQLPFQGKAYIREELRKMQGDMGIELHDIALLLLIPFLELLSPEEQVQASGRAFWWKRDELLHEDVYDIFRAKIALYKKES